MKKMDKEFIEKREREKERKEREMERKGLEMSDVVPVAGLLTARFFFFFDLCYYLLIYDLFIFIQFYKYYS